LSFKDLAARMMGQFMQYYLQKEDKHLVILVATSGDTGSAVANAFYGLENITCIVLFPKDEVTALQRKQMTTLGKNISAYALDGKFDDCQTLVKKAFSDPELSSSNLSSANSINFGRLLPQTIQHFYAYAKAVEEPDKELVISVPSGNFGHVAAGLIAKRMGLRVRKFVAATNANDEFPRFVEMGNYTPLVPSRNCISNAMNVGHPSNLARIIHFENGVMDEKGKILEMPDMAALRNDFFAVSISDGETRSTMRDVYKEHGIMLDPHGAVGWAGLMKYTKKVENWNPSVSFETADPGKFSGVVLDTLGVAPKLPSALAMLKEKSEHFEEIRNNYQEFKALIKKL
jgi:threonine synthase